MKPTILACALAALAACLGAPAKASMPQPLPAPRASFDSGSLHVEVYGTAGKPALVFIPGLTCGPWEWAREIERFAPDYAIYALTLPGFDGQPAIGKPLFQTVSADFWTLLQTRNIDKPVAIGHSLGGTLGLMLAEEHPERLRALVAVDGLPVFPGTETLAPGQRGAAAAQAAAPMSAISTPAQFETIERTYVLPYLMSSPADAAAAAKLVARSDPKATASWMQDDLALDLRPQLTAIDVPVLEIAPFDPQLDGAGPAHLASAAQKRVYYASLLKGDATATVETIEPSRHFIMFDRPDALDAALGRFLSGLNFGRGVEP